MISFEKTYEEILEKARKEITGNTPITNMSAGSRSLVIAQIVSRLLSQYYRDLDLNMKQAFISTAQGEFIDMIGELMSVDRRIGESDDNYRFRISHALENHQGASPEAIRIAALEVENVRDVVLRPYTRGTGSGSVYVVTHSINQLEDAVPAVQEVIDAVSGFGTRIVAESPRLLPVSLSLAVLSKSGVPMAAHHSIIQSVRLAIKRYIDGLAMGDDLLISRIFDEALDSDDRVYDIEILGMWVKDRAVLIQNQQAYWDEKYYVESISDIEAS